VKWNAKHTNSQQCAKQANGDTQPEEKKRVEDRDGVDVDGPMDLLWNDFAMCTLFTADSSRVLHF